MKWLFLIVALIPITAAAQVHKCTVDGRVVYSDRPCPDSGPTVAQSLAEQRALDDQEAKITAECQGWLNTPAAIYNSSWDGSVHEVERWLERNVNNPKTLDFISWGQVVRHCNGYGVRVRFRASNAMGAIITESRIFRFSREGHYIGSDKINWNP